ncbi:hypothetical protein NpPPO83_00002209 [Neofusicoccum parvum]|uniref:Uncharacterized protein n=1 Tax=Neofusicoccum parvum TaxID=310453 RepID=A0ACB5S8R0_9PEZI|nr:hypothetical protein NpPPO83_00002209 [Neofusicoccum parvum]
MLAQSSSGSLIMTQDEALNHAPEHRIASNDEDICTGEATSKPEEKKPDPEKKSGFEKKAGVKRKAAEAMNNGNEMDGESETPSKWGPDIRAPRPKQVPAEELLKMILPYLPSLIQSQIESRFVLDYDKIADLVSEKMHDSVGVTFSSPSKVEAIVDELMKRVNLKSQSVESDIDSTTSQLSDSTKSSPVAPQMDTMPNLLEITDDGEDEDEDSE